MGGVCDTNANAYSFAAQYLDIPFYGLDYPANLTAAEVQDYHHRDYRALIQFIEDHTGSTFDIDRLREVLEEKRKQDELMNELEELQRLVPNPVPGIYHIMIYAGRYIFSGRKKYTRMLREMVAIVRKMPPGKSRSASRAMSGTGLFSLYIDNYSLGIAMIEWFEKMGISHMGNILSRTFAETAPYTTGMPGTTYRIDTTIWTP
jgi:benzoyl-CoA reductase/2-hydroxyglutaryl-CoA dehydratase subunit BcrC/BadD/HgdB